jgi:hypothetical protein
LLVLVLEIVLGDGDLFWFFDAIAAGPGEMVGFFIDY